MDNRHGYKAFSHGMICRKGKYNEKQYAENTDYEEMGGKICHEGMMHYCLNPLDCLDYYPLVDDDGNIVEICPVEALEEPITDDGEKYATKKLHIGAKLDIKGIVSASAEFLREIVPVGGDSARQIGGDWARQVGGNSARQVGGYGARQVGGYGAQQAGGDSARQVGGYGAQQVGGYGAQQAGGDSARQVGGDSARQVGGDSARQIGGDWARQVGGYGAQQVGGYGAQQVGGDWARQVGGKNSVIVAGNDSRFKAGLNSVVLRYWCGKDGNIAGFKAAIVDGETIKADTWYELKGGEFVEVQDDD